MRHWSKTGGKRCNTFSWQYAASFREALALVGHQPPKKGAPKLSFVGCLNTQCSSCTPYDVWLLTLFYQVTESRVKRISSPKHISLKSHSNKKEKWCIKTKSELETDQMLCDLHAFSNFYFTLSARLVFHFPISLLLPSLSDSKVNSLNQSVLQVLGEPAAN